MKLGVNHNCTKESSGYLKSLTQQAVILQKAINHIYSNIPGASIPPPKVCLLNTRTHACKQECNCLFTHTHNCGCEILSLCFSPVFNTKPFHSPSAAQPDMWNHPHSLQVNSETVPVIKKNCVIVCDYCNFNLT